MVDYRSFRLNKLNTPEFSHLWLILFWPLYGIAFQALERWINPTIDNAVLIYCPWDDAIPFLEVFVIPYYLWFAFIFCSLVYTLFFDVKAFRKGMWMFILTYTFTVIVYIVFPNYQNLRPPVMERHNIFTKILEGLYSFDTPTNVFPSLHVIGSIDSLLTVWGTKHFKSVFAKIGLIVLTVAICLSTVFLKQHSLLDIISGVIVCVLFFPFVYLEPVQRWFITLFKKIFRKKETE